MAMMALMPGCKLCARLPERMRASFPSARDGSGVRPAVPSIRCVACCFTRGSCERADLRRRVDTPRDIATCQICMALSTTFLHLVDDSCSGLVTVGVICFVGELFRVLFHLDFLLS